MSRPSNMMSSRYISVVVLTCTYEERDENGGVHEHQSQDGGPAIAKPVRNRTSNKNANKGATLTSLKQRALPFGRDLISLVGRYTVLLLECILRDEVSVQEHVKGLHDLVKVRHC